MVECSSHLRWCFTVSAQLRRLHQCADPSTSTSAPLPTKVWVPASLYPAAPMRQFHAHPNLLATYEFAHRSLRDFGLGKSSMAEGTVGLFTIAGGVAALGLFLWAKGTALRSGRPYQATIEFPLACGITVGTPVRQLASCRGSCRLPVLFVPSSLWVPGQLAYYSGGQRSSTSHATLLHLAASPVPWQCSVVRPLDYNGSAAYIPTLWPLLMVSFNVPSHDKCAVADCRSMSFTPPACVWCSRFASEVLLWVASSM